MKVIRKSALFILVVAAPLYAGPQLPPAGNFPAGADPFASQRSQNNAAANAAAFQIQQQTQARLKEIDRQLQENAAAVAKKKAELKRLAEERKAKGEDLPTEFEAAQNKILRQGRGEELRAYFGKVHEATVHVFALIGNTEVFGDGSAEALAKAKTAFQSVARMAKSIQNLAIQATKNSERTQAESAFQTGVGQLLQSGPSARGIAALNGTQTAHASIIGRDIALFENLKMPVNAISPEKQAAHEPTPGAAE